MPKLSEEDKKKIVERLAGSAGIDESAICDEYGIELEDLEDLMVDSGYERCSECEWWCETGELVGEDCEVQPCDSCRGGSRE